HRDAESTATYLRLAVDDLRAVGLPVPKGQQEVSLLDGHWRDSVPRVRTPVVRPRSQERPPSRFRAAIDRYLANRRSLGGKYEDAHKILMKWDASLSEQHAKKMDQQTFECWARGLAHLAPTLQRARLCAVRNFLVWYRRDRPQGFVPDLASFPKPSPRRPPRLVSREEMARLLATALQLQRSNPNSLRAETI